MRPQKKKILELENEKHEFDLDMKVIDTLWIDRIDRYEKTNLNLRSFLKALPEAIGAMKGVTNHYSYMVEEMKKFIMFDVACNKVNNLGLLLSYGERVGIKQVSGTIKKIFFSEPLIASVCEVLEEISDVTPLTISEVSETFVFCLKEFNDAVREATKRFAQLQERRIPAPSMISELWKVFALSVCADPNEFHFGFSDKKMRLFNPDHQLRTLEDVHSALTFVESLLTQLNKCDSNHSVNVTLKQAVRDDAAVQSAQQQFLVWRESATNFFIQLQAKEALNAYNILLSETLTKITPF